MARNALADIKVSEIDKKGFISVEAPLSIKTIVGGSGVGSPSQGFPAAEERLPGIAGDARRSLAFFDVFPHRRVTTSVYEFVRFDEGTSNSADVVLESDRKPESSVIFTFETGDIDVIAVTAAVSVQVLADVAELDAFLQSLLRYHTLSKFEALCVADLIAAATVYTPSYADNIADSIGETAAAMRAEGWTADVVLLNPLDEFRVATIKSSLNYLAGTLVSTAPTLFGVRQATSSSIPQGTAIVVDAARAATILDREKVTASYGVVDSQFAQNLRTLRVELRGGFCVNAPRAVRKVDLSS